MLSVSESLKSNSKWEQQDVPVGIGIAVQPADLNSVSGTHIVDNRAIYHTLSCDPQICICVMACVNVSIISPLPFPPLSFSLFLPTQANNSNKHF